MEALKPKPAKKSRKPKGAERLETTPSLSESFSQEDDVNDQKDDVNDQKLTARVQSRTESVSEQSRSIYVPRTTDSEAQPYKSVEKVVQITTPVPISELPKELEAIPSSADDCSVSPKESIPVSVVSSSENDCSVSPNVSIPVSVVSSAADVLEVTPSAPPDDEPLSSKIYPDLPLLEMSSENIVEQQSVDVTAIHLPAAMTEEEKLNLFNGIVPGWLDNHESWFLEYEKTLDIYPADDSGWNRKGLKEKLTMYGRLHHQLTGPFVDQRKATQSKLTHLEDEIWRLEERVFESSGVCQDQREVKAKAKRTFAIYDGARGETALESLSQTLDGQIREEKAASMERQYLRSALQHHFTRSFGELEKDRLSEIMIVLAEMLRNEAASQSCTLRDSCPYQRDLRLWFRFICARYMQQSKFLDRLYVLYHVLRLPGGIKSWAVELVQLLPTGQVAALAKHSDQSLENHELREMLTMLEVIMRPVAQRNTLFRAAGALDEAEQFTWVDSDGEGEDATAERMLYPLTEDDMNALLDQLPVAALMQTLKLRVANENFLAGICVAAGFTKALLNGCSTYGSLERYRNFTKRLGRLIDHIVTYENCLLQKPLRSDQLSEPTRGTIVVEYDKFVLETVSVLYRVRSNALWQYLVSLPYDTLTKQTLWHMFFALRSGQFGIEDPFRGTNECVLQELGNDEFYYVLQMLTSIAVAQKGLSNRLEIVCRIAETLMKLVITLDPTEQIKVQYLLDQLRVLIGKYPPLISDSLHLIDRNQSKVAEAEGAENILTVFCSHNIPLRQWSPTREDIDVLLQWFEAFPLGAVLQRLASHLLLSTYYGENSRGQLAVPREWQLDIVRKIVVTYRRHVETRPVDRSTKETVTFTMFTQRCHRMLLQFRVHAMDQPTADVQRTLIDPAPALGEHFVRHLADEPTLKPGVEAACSVSSLAAMLITTAGHWVPIFCQEGLPMLERLLFDNDHCLAIRVLELIVPLFASCPSSLTGNDRFLNLMTLLIAQETSMARADKQASTKNASCERPSLRAMMISQISQYRRYGFLSPAVLVKFWSECIVSASHNIATDTMGLNLLNELAWSALKHRDAWAQMRQTLTPVLKDPAQNTPQRTAWHYVDQVVSMFCPLSSPALFLDVSEEHLALVLLALEIEHERIEVQTGLWPELLHQLDADSSLAVKQALTQVGTTLQLQYTPPPHMLVLYKAARVLAHAKPTHPLFPLLCQRFFTILLARHAKDVPVYGVADRLLTVNVPLIVEVKTHLHRAEAYYASLQRDTSQGQSVRALYARLQSTFEMFAQWMQDRQLNGMSVDDLDRLPAQYCVPRLKKVFAGKQDLWLDLVDLSVQLTKESQAQQQWIRAYRWGLQLPMAGSDAGSVAGSRATAESREVALQRRLEGYAKPAPIPTVSFPDMKPLNTAMKLPFAQRIELILGGLRKIDQHTQRLYWPTIAEFKRLKREILEKTKILYTNESGTAREQAKCSIMCEGAGTVHIPVQVATRNEHTAQRLEDYRRDLASTVEAAIYLPPLIMDDIVQCRMLFTYMVLDTMRKEDKSVVRNEVAGIMKLLRAAFEMLREDSADHLDFAVKDSFRWCLDLFPQLAYMEVVTLLRAAFKQRRKPPTTVMDLLHAKDIPLEPMKAIYELLTTGINKAKQALFIQLFDNYDEFNITDWLLNKNAEAADITRFVTLTSMPLLMEGDGRRGSTEAIDLNEKFYQIVADHALSLAFHAFPVNFCNVLQMMLSSVCGKTALPPMMEVDMVNVIRSKLNLPLLDLPMDDEALRAAHWQLAEANSATKKPVIGMADSVIQTLTSHFDTQRSRIGDSAGLYPLYQHRVRELAVLHGAFAHIFLMEQAKNVRFDTLATYAFTTICRMFQPWLVPYPPTPGSSSLTLPWNGEGVEPASHMLSTMVHVLLSMIAKWEKNSTEQHREGCNVVLPQLLKWYGEHYSDASLPDTVLQPLHAALLKLPWKETLPAPGLVAWIHAALHVNKPERTKFVCHVFVSCAWPDLAVCGWLNQEPTARTMLLLLCMQFALDKTVCSDEHLAQGVAHVLDDVAQLSWVELNPSGLETSLDFYTFTARPSIVLRSPTSPQRQLEDAVLGLLEVASGVSSNARNPLRVDSDDTVKRARYIRTAMRQLKGVVVANRTSVAASNKTTVSLQIAETMRRTLLDVVIRPLEAVVPEDLTGAHVEVQLREARALLTALVMGTRTDKLLHEPFSKALIELLTSDTHASIRKPLAHGLLGVMKLFGESTPNLMALTEVTLFCCLNASAEGGMISWTQALELVSDRVAKGWEPEVLAGDGHVLCLQLHFLAHWRDAAGASDGTSVPKVNQLRQLLRHLKSMKKETDVYHIYPLWVTMVHGLLAMAPTTPTATMSVLVENFSEYLSLIGQQCSPRLWNVFDYVQTLMLGKKIPQASQRIIALGLNCCIVNAYRTLQAAEKEGGTGVAKAAEQSTPEEDPTDALRSLATEPDVEPLREKIEELVESLPSQLETDATMALTKRIIETFDSRAVRILETLHQALGDAEA